LACRSSWFLRRTVLVLPMLIGVTLLVGQLNEARQFNAFVPIGAALVVCTLRGRRRDLTRLDPAGIPNRREDAWMPVPRPAAAWPAARSTARR
jgi:hypothetical protein